jgi:hypothetical protein
MPRTNRFRIRDVPPVTPDPPPPEPPAANDNGNGNDVESPAEKFIRLATSRVRHLLNELRILGNLSNRASYRYNEQQVAEIFEAIDDAVSDAKARFRTKRPDFHL